MEPLIAPPPGVRFEVLQSAHLPLLNKFYKQHRSPMRSHGEQAWVARRDSIIAALKLTPVEDGRWLTGLFCDPAERGKRIASALLRTVLAQQQNPLWLFCEPALMPFYARLGFSPCQTLPAVLAERLQRYQRTRTLLAMVHPSSQNT